MVAPNRPTDAPNRDAPNRDAPSRDARPREVRPVDDDERRRQRRLPVQIEVEYEVMEDFLSDVCANLSGGGMFICTAQPLAEGARFRLRFRVPDHPRPIDTVARVMWTQRPGPGLAGAAGMGVRFEDLSPGDQRAVDGWLASWAAEGEPSL
jgi:uncharacterized protein (TIGR02266 family)